MGFTRIGLELAPLNSSSSRHRKGTTEAKWTYFELIVVCYYFPLNYVNIISWELCHLCVSVTQLVFHSGKIKRPNGLLKMCRNCPTTQEPLCFRCLSNERQEVAWFIGLGPVLSSTYIHFTGRENLNKENMEHGLKWRIELILALEYSSPTCLSLGRVQSYEKELRMY